jgi:hypothetical protein
MWGKFVGFATVLAALVSAAPAAAENINADAARRVRDKYRIPF